MARPELISRLHEARYEMQFATEAEKQEKERIYLELLKEVSQLYKASEAQVQRALADDFHVWRRQEQLPPPPRRS